MVGRVFWSGAVGPLLDGDGEQLDEALRRLEERELVVARLGSAFAGQARVHLQARPHARRRLREPPAPRPREAHARWPPGSRRPSADRRPSSSTSSHTTTPRRTGGRCRTERPTRRELGAFREKAFGYLLSAAREATHRAVFAHGRRLAGHALDLARSPVERATALEVLGDAHQAESRGDDAWQALTEAIRIRAEDVPADREAIALPLRPGSRDPRALDGGHAAPAGRGGGCVVPRAGARVRRRASRRAARPPAVRPVLLGARVPRTPPGSPRTGRRSARRPSGRPASHSRSAAPTSRSRHSTRCRTPGTSSGSTPRRRRPPRAALSSPAAAATRWRSATRTPWRRGRATTSAGTRMRARSPTRASC